MYSYCKQVLPALPKHDIAYSSVAQTFTINQKQLKPHQWLHWVTVITTNTKV